MTEDHRAEQDPEGLALRCSCGSWAMLFRNVMGLNATQEHRHHAAYERVVAERDAALRDVALCEKHSIADERDMRTIADERDRLRSDLNQATAVVEAATAWRDQFTEPDVVKWPRRGALIAAIDAYRRAAPTGGVEG